MKLSPVIPASLLIVACICAIVFGQAGKQGEAKPAAAIEFDLLEGSRYRVIRQPGVRDIYVDPQAVSSFVIYAPGKAPDVKRQYALYLNLGPNQYRLDCSDAAEAKRAAEFFTTQTAGEQ